MESSTTTTQKQMKSFTCPTCGWMVKTPFSENDLMDHINLHAKTHHPDMKMNPEDIKKIIK